MFIRLQTGLYAPPLFMFVEVSVFEEQRNRNFFAYNEVTRGKTVINDRMFESSLFVFVEFYLFLYKFALPKRQAFGNHFRTWHTGFFACSEGAIQAEYLSPIRFKGFVDFFHCFEG